MKKILFSKKEHKDSMQTNFIIAGSVFLGILIGLLLSKQKNVRKIVGAESCLKTTGVFAGSSLVIDDSYADTVTLQYKPFPVNQFGVASEASLTIHGPKTVIIQGQAKTSTIWGEFSSPLEIMTPDKISMSFTSAGPDRSTLFYSTGTKGKLRLNGKWVM